MVYYILNIYLEGIKKNLINKRNWTNEEDEKLKNFIEINSGKNWKKIALIIGNKTSQQCAYRYNKLVKLKIQSKWNRNEDIFLMELVENFDKNWQQISKYLSGRSEKEIQERFEKKLDPNLKRCKFEKEEDDLIISLQNKYGNNWKEISRHLKDRNAYMIKNRYYSFLKKNSDKELSITNETPFSNDHSFKSKFTKNSTGSKYSSLLMKKSSTVNSNDNMRKNLEHKLIMHDKELSNHAYMRNISCGDAYKNECDNSLSYNDSFIMKKFEEIYKKEGSEAGSNFSSLGNMDKSFNNLKFEGDISRMKEFDINLKNQSTFFKDKEGISNCLSNDVNNNYLYNYENNIAGYTFTQVNSDLKSKSNIYYDPQVQDELLRRFSSNSKNMIIDDLETNTIPKDFIKIDTGSPKQSKKANNFNENYERVFQNNNNKNSFDKIEINENNKNFNFVDNSILINQYKLLEEVFNRVKEVGKVNINSHLENSYKNINDKYHSNPKYNKLVTLHKKLDEKGENLSNELKLMKHEYFVIISQKNDQTHNKIRKSLIRQIEILIEILKTTKLKIKLMEEIDEELKLADQDSFMYQK